MNSGGEEGGWAAGGRPGTVLSSDSWDRVGRELVVCFEATAARDPLAWLQLLHAFLGGDCRGGGEEAAPASVNLVGSRVNDRCGC